MTQNLRPLRGALAFDNHIQGLEPGRRMGDLDGGIMLIGDHGTIMGNCYGESPRIVPESAMRKYGRPPRSLERIPDGPDGHEQDWIRACKENPGNRIEPFSNFDMAGPFNEMVVMGVLGVRLQSLNKVLDWDGENMQFTNLSDDEKIKTVIKDGFTIKDGHPSFDKTWTDPVSAKEFAAELIKHTYRKPWSLPDMPA